MSACISSEGEYSQHTPDDEFTCTRCFVLDEDAMRATLTALRAKVERLQNRAEGAEGVLVNDTRIIHEVRRRAEAAEAVVTKVRQVRQSWAEGHEPVHHRGYIADIDRALPDAEAGS